MLSRSAYPVEVIIHLKTLCRHPLLLEASAITTKLKKDAEAASGGIGKSAAAALLAVDEEDETDALCEAIGQLDLKHSHTSAAPPRKIKADASLFDILNRPCSFDEIMAGSIKLRVLLQLTRRLHRAGHRMLVFSQSRLMLDIIQRALAEKGLASVRIDGTVKGHDRQGIIDSFNRADSDEDGAVGPSICLLTTKACGTGITLTGADRVIIYDPSWNPAEDRQAVDRAFRLVIHLY